MSVSNETSRNQCRACLTQNETFTHFLFNNVSAETYWFCTSIEVAGNDEHSKALCSECYDLLIKFSQFKRTCIESNKALITTGHPQGEKDLQWTHSNEDNGDIKRNNHFNIENVSSQLDNDLLDEGDDDTTSDINAKDEDEKIDGDKKTKSKRRMCKVTSLKNKFSFSCELCKRKFGHRDRFEAHKAEHQGKTVAIGCSSCGAQFATWSGLRRHAAQHEPGPLTALRCGDCGRVCASGASLRAHRRTHAPRPTLVCHVCGRTCATRHTLAAHLETHVAPRERQCACAHCDARFYTAAALRAHEARRHAPHRRFECERCARSFADKYALVAHVRAHDAARPHACALCDAVFARRGSLAVHVRSHSGERPFACALCSARFRSARTRRDHVRTHTGERPHGCPLCARAFAQRGSLKRHMRVHAAR